MSKNKKVLVVAAHPDDEILGVGATMARHIAEGDKVEVIIVAEGVTSRQNERSRTKAKSELSDLAKAAKKANSALGVTDLKLLDLPDNRLDSMDMLDVIKTIESAIKQKSPDIVYTHFPSDLNVDHQIIAQAMLTIFRPQPGNNKQEIYFFEVPSSTEWFPGGTVQNGYFHPNHFVEIKKYYSKKAEALKAYKSEMREFPHARSIEALEALAKWRGASVGFEFAEAFQLARSCR